MPRSVRPLLPSLALSVGIGLFAGPALAGGPPNDDCSTPTPLAGDGFFGFDTTGATTGPQGQLACGSAGDPGIANDVWFCWTATCTGTVRISTCGLTALDTRIALYAGCGCPDQDTLPLCCDDDACGLQSEILCEVVCGQEYMIQVGQRPGGLPGGPGELFIECLGDCDPLPEPGPCTIAESQCCFGRPAYDAADYQLFAGGPVAFMTASPGVLGGQVLTAYDFSDFSSAVPGMSFPAQRYSDPDWTAARLGSIFGITLDAGGNVYVTPTIVYNFDQAGIGTMGDVYRIDAVTGAVSVFTAVPLPNSGVGLGNIIHDCDHDQFFVTDFEDGRIHRLDAGGVLLSSFDHGVQDDGTAGIAPLGDRPWGVTVHGDRVYYALWNEDSGRPSAASNEIWSVALLAGDFSGAPQLEVAIPARPGATYSNPVADIRFSPDGRMFLAERSMFDDTSPSAHDSRLLEYVCEDGLWTLGAAYDTGVIPGLRNAAGGVDVDHRPGERIWATADAIQFAPDVVYGAQGLPDGGGDVSTSVLLDYQGDLTQQDKTAIGDIAISCPAPCGRIEIIELECVTDDEGFTGEYDALVSVTNDSGVPVTYLLFPGSAVQPNVVVLDPILQDGDKVLVPLHLVGLAPGEEHCLTMVMADEEVEACCTLELCFITPDCDCMEFTAKDAECDPATGAVTLTITFQNLAPYAAEHAFLIVESPAGATISPSYVDLPTVPTGGLGIVGPLTITGVGTAEEICIRLTTHAEDLVECCSEVTCVPVPECGGQFDACDLDEDGVVDFNDLVMLLSAWGPCGSPCPADLDGGGSVGFSDLTLLLASWTAG